MLREWAARWSAPRPKPRPNPPAQTVPSELASILFAPSRPPVPDLQYEDTLRRARDIVAGRLAVPPLERRMAAALVATDSALRDQLRSHA